jgi:hypothetical protein
MILREKGGAAILFKPATAPSWDICRKEGVRLGYSVISRNQPNHLFQKHERFCPKEDQSEK